jgi:hypothetical protein
MADIRINSLSTTASASSSDDFLAIDGTTNGTRKLSAYSPTFGGNLTVSGTGGITSSSTSPLLKATTTALGAVPKLTLENTNLGAWNVYLSATDGGDFKIDQDSTNKFRLAFGTGNATLAGNLTVSGTGNHYFSGQLNVGLLQASSLATFNGGVTVAGGALTVSGTGQSSIAGNLKVNNQNAAGDPTSLGSLQLYSNAVTETGTGGLEFKADGAGSGYGFRSLPVFNGVSAYDLYTQSRSNSASWTTRMALTSTGNLLIGTTTDSANGKLQLATHTTSAGGIGFGTDTSLFRSSAGVVQVYGTSANAVLSLTHSSTTAAKGFDIQIDGSKDAYVWLRENRNLYIGTNGTTALTLDSSQNATFAGTIATQGGTASTPASASATGTAGTIKWDASYIYVCTAANTWKRVAIATW